MQSSARIFAEKLATTTWFRAAVDAAATTPPGTRQDIPALMSAVVEALVKRPELLRDLAAETEQDTDLGLPMTALFDNQPLPESDTCDASCGPCLLAPGHSDEHDPHGRTTVNDPHLLTGAPVELAPVVEWRVGQIVTGVVARDLPAGSVLKWEMDEHDSGFRRHTVAHGWLPRLADTVTYRIVQVGYPAAASAEERAA